MTPLLELLVNGLSAGTWPVDHFGSVRRRLVESFGHRVVVIDVDPQDDKIELLDRVAAALGLPEWFGRNWDALNDSLLDLSPSATDALPNGQNGNVVVLRAFDRATGRPSLGSVPGTAAATMIEIFDQVTEETGLCVFIVGFDAGHEPTIG